MTGRYLPGFPVSTFDPVLPTLDFRLLTIKIPLAWILDNICGFKGLRVGEVGVYKNQALVLINFGKGTAAEIVALTRSMQEKVYEMTGIKIEPEVEWVGFR